MKKTFYLFIFIIFISSIVLTYRHNKIITMNKNEFISFLESDIKEKDSLYLKKELKNDYIISYKPVSFHSFDILGLELRYLNIKINKNEIKIREIEHLKKERLIYSSICKDLLILEDEEGEKKLDSWCLKTLNYKFQ